MTKETVDGVSQWLQIVVSLPRRNGLQMKDTLKKIADENGRSLANLIVMILTSWLRDNGYEPEKTEQPPAKEDTGSNASPDYNAGRDFDSWTS
tara:strand:- start:1377 stop:1655 length:279 start_codon:yes stop_codon:yes gene_type:complete